jgi:predicted TIM-barrel fold metal-dependent hydrolase
MDRYLVVSADGHAGPPADQYREYLDPAFHAAFDDHQRNTAELRNAELRAARAGGKAGADFLQEWEKEGADLALRAAWDSDARNLVLDKEGVAAEVLFPDADVLGTSNVSASPFGSGLGSSGDSEPAQVLAGARAHNRWMAEFCRKSPERRVGLAIVPIVHDIDAAVAEIRAARDMGLRGVIIPTRWMSRPSYNHPRYEPVWATCEELGMVVHTHSASGPTDYSPGPGLLGIYTTEAVWFAARPMWVLIWAGVFERYPKLRFVVAENGAYWVPDILMKMDARWEGDHATRKFGADAFRGHLALKPSDYFRRNVRLAASTPHEVDLDRRHAIGVDNMMWGNDLPHPEGTYPRTREWLRERFAALPRDEVRQMLGGNAAELYGLDVTALKPHVDRIGPTLEEVHGRA